MKKLYVFLFTLCIILTNSVSSQVATWMHGDMVANQFGVYGTQGIPDAANKPGGRQGAACFTDAGYNFWLFGGNGLSAIDDGPLNDLWKYSSITKQWTWVSGGTVANGFGIYGIKGIPDAANKPGGRQDASSWVDASGFLWLMGGYGYSATGLGYLNDLWKYNPTTNQWTWVSGDNVHNQNGVYAGLAKPGSRIGAVSWADGAGNLWLMGGSGYASIGIGLLNDLWKYNTVLNSWTWVNGSNVPNQPGVYGTQGVMAPTNIPGSRSDAVAWFANNYLWLMGGDGFTESSNGVLNDLWKYDPLSNQWTWVSGDNTPNQLGVYGTKGTGSGSNKPGSRRNATCWKVMYGALWLMGGEGFAALAPGWMNDVWKFDLSTNLWTWMQGNDGPYQNGVYGTREVPAASNNIGSRFDNIGWCDADNNLWTFGGKGLDVTTGGFLSDLWRVTDLPATTSNLYYRDNDGDSYGDPTNSVLAVGTPPAGYVTNNRDCNDNNGAVHPGATEICNGIDDNCNGQIDEGGGSTTYYRDADADGYGDPGLTSQACAPPTGFVLNNTDCNDANANIHPGAAETCNGMDDNCNGQIDEGCGTGTTYYRDSDNDGYGDPNVSTQATTPPAGYVANNTDCDDTKAAVHPGAVEICNGIDDNCNGQIDEEVKSTFYLDSDGDGYGNAATSTQACTAPAGYVSNNTDCDDTKASVNPVATEVCNGIDDNCNGQVDEGCGTTTTYYRDADSDGFGDPNVSTQATTPPAGYVSNNTDCDDTRSSVYPGATELCNGIDDNCNGQVDEGVKSTFYLDADGDGYGTAASSTQACTAPAGYVNNSTDCDDSKASVYPGAAEVCNGIDDNCNGQIDEGVKTTFYRDADGDGYGTAATSTQACTAPAGYVNNNSDCDDTKASVHPGATELCNGIDDDCDNQVDEGTANTTYYKDGDGDGYGNASISTLACVAPTGYVSNNTDCNDASASIHPGATELCNGVDDNCNGQIDEGASNNTFYKDADADGYGNPNISTQACTAPIGFVTNNTDCNDGRASVHPGATELCNGVDDDCDGQVDEGVKSTFYRDADRDGYGNPNISIQACTAPTGYVNNNTDCNDGNANIRPGAAEQCNGIDDNCNGQIDEGVRLTFYRDADRDGYGNAASSVQSCIIAPAGYVSNKTDCNDNNPRVHPAATEICNGIDDDCDGQVDEGVRATFYRDADGDGYGTATTSTQACTAPSGYVSNSTDCNDANVSVHPGAFEVCNNNIDEDCDGQVDEGCNTSTNQICAFDEDFYGSLNTTCVVGTQITSKQIMQAAVDAQPNDSVSFGSKTNRRFFTLRLADVQNNDIFKMLPGAGDEKALKGYATFSKPNTWNNVPIASNGRIDNELLAQTMTLFFNIHISPTLKNLSLDKKIVIRKLYFCSVAGSQETVSFNVKKSILNCLKSRFGANGATVNNLYVLANELLGNIKSCDKVKEKDVRKALENINKMFGRCVIFYGYGPADNGEDDDDGNNNGGDGDDDDDNNGNGNGNGNDDDDDDDGDDDDGDDDDGDDDDGDDDDDDRIIGNNTSGKVPVINGKNLQQTLQVSASPNPFRDRIQFTIKSPVSGDVHIVIFDVNGKQVGEIKQRVYTKSSATINYIFNRRRQGMLFYKVTVNHLSATGKLVQID